MLVPDNTSSGTVVPYFPMRLGYLEQKLVWVVTSRVILESSRSIIQISESCLRYNPWYRLALVALTMISSRSIYPDTFPSYSLSIEYLSYWLTIYASSSSISVSSSVDVSPIIYGPGSEAMVEPISICYFPKWSWLIIVCYKVLSLTNGSTVARMLPTSFACLVIGKYHYQACNHQI